MELIQELKKMSPKDVKNFIRERLMYSQEFIEEIRKSINHGSPAYDLLLDVKPNIKLHYRFDMSEDCAHNNNILSKFNDLKLMQSFYVAQLKFHKGCGTFFWCKNDDEYVNEENLCGLGTVDIIHFIMSKAWGLKL